MFDGIADPSPVAQGYLGSSRGVSERDPARLVRVGPASLTPPKAPPCGGRRAQRNSTLQNRKGSSFREPNLSHHVVYALPRRKKDRVVARRVAAIAMDRESGIHSKPLFRGEARLIESAESCQGGCEVEVRGLEVPVDLDCTAQLRNRLFVFAQKDLSDAFKGLPVIGESVARAKAQSRETYLGADDAPAYYRAEMYSIVAKDLTSFNEELLGLEAQLEREIPPREFVEECSNLLRSAVMPSHNVTTNIHVTNSQIGLLNTGAVKDIKSIDASITTLKSQGNMEVGEAFKKLAEGIARDDMLEVSNKAELLSNVKYLSEMSAKGSEERNHGVIKSVLRSVSELMDFAAWRAKHPEKSPFDGYFIRIERP
jgi:hypothetical protein